MTTPWVEYCLWALAGAVIGAGLTFWSLRNVQGSRRLASIAGESRELGFLKDHQQAWYAFAAHAVSMIPVLVKQMEGVTHQTERAAMDLMVHIRALVSSGSTASKEDRKTDLSKVIVAMQFQDMTRQKLEHVSQALDQWQQHLHALLKGPLDEDAKRQIAAMERLEQIYTMEEERRLHAAAMTQDYQEPVSIGTDQRGKESDSVTLF